MIKCKNESCLLTSWSTKSILSMWFAKPGPNQSNELDPLSFTINRSLCNLQANKRAWLRLMSFNCYALRILIKILNLIINSQHRQHSLIVPFPFFKKNALDLMSSSLAQTYAKWKISPCPPKNHPPKMVVPLLSFEKMLHTINSTQLE